jgi:hypothetical protein
MAALGVDAELRLVDRRECEIGGQVAALLVLRVRHRHAFGGAQHVARLGRDDPLLAGQQSDLLGALQGDDPVVDLARQQPQREADDPRRVGAHPLDGEIGLAGVGGPKDRPDRCLVTPRHPHECGSARPKSKFLSSRNGPILSPS